MCNLETIINFTIGKQALSHQTSALNYNVHGTNLWEVHFNWNRLLFMMLPQE